MWTETPVTVCTDPQVDLFVARTCGPADAGVLAIHGGPDWDHSYLREPLDRLAGRHRLILPDLRGCGLSTTGLDDDQYTPDAVINDLISLLDILGADRADVLGFSYGGLLAQRLALTAPHRVRRLIIASSSVLPVPDNAFQNWAERDRRLAADVAFWSNTTLSGPELTRQAAIAAAPANVWREAVLPDYLARIGRVRFSAEWSRLWQAGRLPSPRCDDAAVRLAALGIPILLLHGRHDMTFPVGLVEQTTPLIPATRAVVLDNAGHMAHIDQPEQWITAVGEFLE